MARTSDSWLYRASFSARSCSRLPGASASLGRSADWAKPRPNWPIFDRSDATGTARWRCARPSTRRRCGTRRAWGQTRDRRTAASRSARRHGSPCLHRTQLCLRQKTAPHRRSSATRRGARRRRRPARTRRCCASASRRRDRSLSSLRRRGPASLGRWSWTSPTAQVLEGCYPRNTSKSWEWICKH